MNCNENNKYSINLLIRFLRLEYYEFKILIINFCLLMLSYMFMYINLPQSSDTLRFYTISDGYIKLMIYSGRWFRSLWFILIKSLGYYNVIPFFNLIITALLMSYSLILILKIFDIKSIFLKCMFISLFSITPPFLELYLSYHEIFDNAIALFFIAISLYFGTKCNKILLSSLFICFATGIYQVYFNFAISLLIIYLINSIYNINDKFDFRIFVYKVLRFVFLILISFGLYYCIYRFAQCIINSDSRFNGGFIDFSLLGKSLLKVFAMVAVMPFKSYAGFNTTLLTKFLFAIIYAYLFIKTILFINKNKTIFKFLIIPLYIILPVAFSLHVFSGQVTAIRSCISLGLIFLLVIIYLDFDFNNRINLKVASSFISIVMCIFVVHYVYYANGFSYHAYLVNETSKAYAVELVSKIKSLDYYNTDRKIAFCFGNDLLNNDGYYYYADNSVFPIDVSGITFDFKDMFENGINVFGAFEFEPLDYDSLIQIKELNEYKQMPIYPNAGSIRLINDVIVVKLSK